MLLNCLFPRRRGRRSLASAFVGEIVAAMEAVSDHAEVRRLLVANANGDTQFDFGGFELPHLAVYETNVSRLWLFHAPLPRELSYFYTRLMTLPGHLRALSSGACSSPAEAQQRTKIAYDEVSQTMDLGDSLLRNIKKLVSQKQPNSISRA
jgi:hypothetical protein